MNSPFYAGTRELKNKTNELIRLAGSGKTVIVTRYGKPVATLKPFRPEDLIEKESSIYEKVRQSIASDLPGLTEMSTEELQALNDELSASVKHYPSWEEMDRAAKGDRHGLSR